MIFQDAYEAAQRFLTAHVRGGEALEVVIASATERPSAWTFGYNTRRFLEEGDFGASMIGNGPVVVPKDGAAMYLVQSGSPVEDQLG